MMRIKNTGKDLMRLREFNHEAFILMLMNCSRDISLKTAVEAHLPRSQTFHLHQ